MTSEISQAPTVHRFLETSALKLPDKVACVHEQERVTYREINLMANRLALFLLEQGVSRGDRIVLLLQNSVTYIAAYYGVLKAGGVAVPLNADSKPESLASLFDELTPRAIITCGKSEQLVRDAGPQRAQIPLLVLKDPSGGAEFGDCRVVPWDDIMQQGEAANPEVSIKPAALASIIYTSGSTGKPKGVMLSHRNIVANTASIVEYLELTEADIQMVVLPFFYVMGKSLLNTHFSVGGTVVLNNSFAYPAAVVQQMAAERITGFSGVPSTYAYLLHRSPLAAFRERLGSLRYCTQAGGHMSRDLKEKLLQTLPPHTRLFVMYGATEAAARLTYVEPELLSSKIESIGKAIPGVTMRVVDEQGNELPRGEHGELVASGPNIMQGYWNDPAATARALDHNGYHTGDLGYQEEDGYLYVTGRKDDLLKVGGHRVDPQEVEDALMATGLLLEVAVLGVDDDLLGKRLAALAVPLSGTVQESEILALCHARLPRHKLPSEIHFVPALPKYASSKIDRPGCLALLRTLPSGQGSGRGPGGDALQLEPGGMA